MKVIYLTALLCTMATSLYAQPTNADSTKATSPPNDTIRIGSIIIIKQNKRGKDTTNLAKASTAPKKNKKLSTNYFVLDVGFADWVDNTNYATAGNAIINRPGTVAFSQADMRLKAGRSANINLWLFMQKLALVKNNVNLKYGFGVEWHNYNFRGSTSFKESGLLPNGSGTTTNTPFVFRDSISFSKNKLNLKYVSVPLLLNFASNKLNNKSRLSASVGVSAGYLIRQRNKQISTDRDKQKNQGDFDMQKFRLSYIGELGLGPVRLYGSYSPNSLFANAIDVRPYTIGIRFSNW